MQTVLGNENRILTVSAYVKSEVHDIGDVCIGVPARINREGVFPITIKIDQNEIVQFQNSVEKIRGITSELMRLLEKEEL